MVVTRPSPYLLGALAGGLVGGFVLSGCASPTVERLDDTPRSVSIPGTGVFRWSQPRGWTQPDRGTWGDPAHVWTESRRALEAGAYADALAGFLVLKERLPAVLAAAGPAESNSAEPYKELNYFIAECYFQLGRYEEALEHYRPVYRTDLPSPELVDQARRRVFDIGMAYLKERAACEFLGILSYSCPEHGIDILVGTKGGLITENRSVSYADDALIEVANFYFEIGEYPEAVPLYDRIVTEYEQSPWNDVAEYQAALAVFRQIRGVNYDQAIFQEAEKRFSAYLRHHPRGARTQESRDKLREISEMRGAQYLRIAKFYLRDGQPRSCEIYLRRVLMQHPNSVAAKEARQIQKQLDRAGGNW